MKTLADLKKIREKAREEMKLRYNTGRIKIVVGMGTSGIATGARAVMKTFLEEISRLKLTDVSITQTGEKGLTSMEPIVDVIEAGKDKVTYGNLTPEKVRQIVAEHVITGKIVSDYVVSTGS